MYYLLLTVMLLTGERFVGVYNAGTGAAKPFATHEACVAKLEEQKKEFGPKLENDPNVIVFGWKCEKLDKAPD